MNLKREIVADASIGVGVADAPDGLSDIHHPGCAAVIWRRQPLPRFQEWLNTLPPEQLPRTRMILRADQVHGAVHHICETSGTPDCVERTRLIDDVAALAGILSDLMDTAHVRLRLDVADSTICGRFHIDAVTARLICTYRGTGTQYGVSTDGSAPSRVFSVPTGSPFLTKGRSWVAGPTPGVLHRSPPVESAGETRLLLVLDPMAGPPEPPTRATAALH